MQKKNTEHAHSTETELILSNVSFIQEHMASLFNSSQSCAGTLYIVIRKEGHRLRNNASVLIITKTTEPALWDFFILGIGLNMIVYGLLRHWILVDEIPFRLNVFADTPGLYLCRQDFKIFPICHFFLKIYLVSIYLTLNYVINHSLF